MTTTGEVGRSVVDQTPGCLRISAGSRSDAGLCREVLTPAVDTQVLQYGQVYLSSYTGTRGRI